MKSDLPAKDIYSALWPLHFVSKIFGLAPYSLKRDDESVTNKSLSNCFCRIWSIFWIILLMAFEYINTNNLIEIVNLKERILEALFSSSMYTCSFVSLLLPLTIYRDKIPQIITKLSEIDQVFATMKYGAQTYENTRLFITVQISVTTFTVFALMSYAAYVIHGNFSFRNFHYFFFEIFPTFLNCITILHFVNLVLLLRDKYKFLNSKLETSIVLPRNVTNLNDIHMNCITPIENCTFEMKYFSRDTREMNISSRRNQPHNLRIIYSLLHEVAHLINSTFGILLLCTTLWVLISIICGINYVLKIKHTDSSLYVIVAVLWSIFCASLMTLMAMSCSLAVNECNRSPVIVQNIMLREDIDLLVMKELKKMFIQFKVMKIGFSACGMYRIDLSFLCSIFGATLSYLIIFWQL
ncbi:hypothetical protein B7P43_G15982 [Cryptotermes secundus]|uniref:Gustatory receptor n=1 Tax=Cryptotermes secundus TaxID=105785 RepID=A0A2J7PFI1_9NEOP|nr:hypothetical protein B7P43_G15982 [Cryptotermes secundus]